MKPGGERDSLMHVAAGYKHFAENEERSSGEFRKINEAAATKKSKKQA